MSEILTTITEEKTIVVDGRQRRYLVTRPIICDNPSPLVLVLHGSNQTPEIVRQFTEPGFDVLASRAGAIVVYPGGYRKHWNDARISTNFAARVEGYDDVAFLKAIVSGLVNSGEADPTRVFAVGYSLGGQMVNRLAHEAPELLAGIAMIGATQPALENFKPAADVVSPMPVLLIHGTKDPNVPYEGGMASILGFRPRGLGMSAPETARYWAARNGIDTDGVTSLGPAGSNTRTSVERTDFRSPGKPSVALFTIHGGGHVIPGRKAGPWIMGRTSDGIISVEEIARFFELSS
ncbi:hypothetical protein B7R54_15035 [Subtercola boreus]|uniref:Phospholipase/carboxylesterase/thioesterase domain-containing protein n=1 Tax=Subtercola boreus TaxID=120213 RepID=A0A3E0VLR9_9MICO|nr:PHB depolymerase family esterase [Subtercola boreus]RFA10373.1 hypothetical protein B7R54_15035 [Subtercola boreus]TQL56111.1 polyhydroxybutyrate depolymerase [Subtercola boreus]